MKNNKPNKSRRNGRKPTEVVLTEGAFSQPPFQETGGKPAIRSFEDLEAHMQRRFETAREEIKALVEEIRRPKTGKERG